MLDIWRISKVGSKVSPLRLAFSSAKSMIVGFLLLLVGDIHIYIV